MNHAVDSIAKRREEEETPHKEQVSPVADESRFFRDLLPLSHPPSPLSRSCIHYLPIGDDMVKFFDGFGNDKNRFYGYDGNRWQ